jgi:hypothetical protein
MKRVSVPVISAATGQLLDGLLNVFMIAEMSRESKEPCATVSYFQRSGE